MKKLIALILILCCVSCCALAEDFSSMSDEELSALLNNIRIELLSRLAKVEEKTILVDDDDIQIYITGKGVDEYDGFRMEVVFMNKSSRTLGVQFDHIVIDGWEVDSFVQLSQIGAGKKSKDYIALDYKGAEMESYKEMADVELSFHTFGEDWRSVKDYKEIKFDFNGGSWS